MADGFYRVPGVGDIMPTIDERKVANFQWISSFTADASTNIITTALPHTQIAGEVVMLTSTGTLPAPFEAFELYRICTPGLGANVLKLALNIGWSPPPENPPIDILDSGTGTHFMWIRPLEYIAEVIGDPIHDFILTEEPGITRGAIYFKDAVRFQLTGGSGMSGVVRGHDYWSSRSQHTPKTKWKITIGGSDGEIVHLVNNGQASLRTYGYPANSLWGLGILGAVIGGGESYYNLCGACTFGNGGGGGGGDSGKGQDQLSPDRQIRIEYKDQDITNLVRRAQKASSTIENLSIVGQGVSGGAGAWQINPD